jgi:hypothetical protein
MGDRSLDEFVQSGDESDAASGAERTDGANKENDDGRDGKGSTDERTEAKSETDDVEHERTASPEERTDAEPEAETVEPAAGTSRWSRDGERCVSCGEDVSRLWFEDGDAVCVACKDW